MADQPPSPQEILAKLDYHVPDSVVTRFANQATVIVHEGACYITFYEAIPPLFLGTPEEVQSQIESTEKIRATAVGRFVLPASFVPKLIKVLTTVLVNTNPEGQQRKGGEETSL